MSKLRLSLGCRWYDRVAPLIDGTVQPEGIDLTFVEGQPAETFWRVLYHSEFDVCEISTAGYLITLEREPAPYIAIPVFPSRLFRHGNIYISTRSGIAKPEDLRGKRIGTPEYSQTAALWVRGILQDEHGVDVREVQWYRGGLEAPDPVERVELTLPPHIHLHEIPADASLNAMLEAGELDAVVSPQAPSSFVKRSPNVARLFPNWREAEEAYYQKTRMFPIMHTVAIKRSIYERDPWIAASLMKAFEEAKRWAYEKLVYTGVLSVSLPWLHADLEREFAAFGRDPFGYGLEPNRKELDAMVRYSYEQGMTHRLMNADELFAPEAVEMFQSASRYGQSGPSGPMRYIQAAGR